MKNKSNPYETIYEEPQFSPIHPGAWFGNGVKVMHYVVIEDRCLLDDGCFVGNHVMIREDCSFGKRCVIGHGAVFEAHGRFGNHVTINAQCHMTQGIVVEDEVFFGPGVITMNTRHICYGRKIPKIYSPPIILYGSRIGAGAMILPGVSIGPNALIGAGSTVTRHVGGGMIAVGNPARIVGRVPEEELL